MEFSEKDKQRFWAKVNKTDTCWLWTSGCQQSGHGRFYVNNTKVYAHRASWFLAGNTIPEGHIIRHKCRSKNCVNPEHLETGTYAENSADMIRDGTSLRGSKNHANKLTEDQVRVIKARSKENQVRLGKEFGVRQSTIYNIIIGKTWGWLT